MLQYEDTVRPEIEPCDKCGILTDEGDAEYLGDLRVCPDCCDEILEPLKNMDHDAPDLSGFDIPE